MLATITFKGVRQKDKTWAAADSRHCHPCHPPRAWRPTANLVNIWGKAGCLCPHISPRLLLCLLCSQVHSPHSLLRHAVLRHTVLCLLSQPLSMALAAQVLLVAVLPTDVHLHVTPPQGSSSNDVLLPNPGNLSNAAASWVSRASTYVGRPVTKIATLFTSGMG